MFGWLLYLGTLVPVIGIVQTGAHAMAERYTYIPYTGIFIMLAWLVFELYERYVEIKKYILLMTFLFVVMLYIKSWIYLSYWQNDFKIFTNVLRIHDGGYSQVLETKGGLVERPVNFGLFRIYNNLGVVLLKAGLNLQAAIHFNEAVRINPVAINALYNLVLAYERSGEVSKALVAARRLQLINQQNRQLSSLMIEQLINRIEKQK